MNKLIFILFAFAFITTLSACKKFLDKKQNTSLVTPQTVADLQALLDDADRTMNTGVSPSFGEASSDDLFVPENTLNTLLGWTQYAYRWQPYAYRFPNDWSQAYIPIYNTNYCLEMLLKNERSAANTSEWDNVYGSALFYRAYYFLQLNWIYAKAYDEATASSDPGIVLRLTSDFNVPSERASVENCYKKIIEDVMEASYRLPAYARHVFRPSKAAAYGLLARTYLSMRKYDSAYKYADLCLGIKNELMNYNGDEEIGTITANNPFKRFNKETIFYAEMGTDGLFSLIAPARSRADTVFYESYEDTDLRKKAFFLLASGYYRFKGSYSQSTIPFTGIATDEIYLIRAECSARKGGEGIDQAISDMNKLLSHRYTISGFVPLNYTNPALLLDRILEERRKELFFRGIRWSDIKRLNKEGRNIILRRKVGNDIYELKPNANYYALPLPADIIEQAGIKQNEP